MTFRDYLSLYKYTWIFSAVFFVLSAISLALENIIHQFFAFMFIVSTAISFISIFIVNAVILTKFRNNKRYMKLYNKLFPLKKSQYSDTSEDPAYSTMAGNRYYTPDINKQNI